MVSMGIRLRLGKYMNNIKGIGGGSMSDPSRLGTSGGVSNKC